MIATWIHAFEHAQVPYYLRGLGSEDVTERYVAWLNDPQTNQHLAPRSRPATHETQRAYVQEIELDPHRLLFGLFDRQDKLQGTMGVQFATEDSAWMGILLGEENVRGRGLGTSMIREASAMLFRNVPRLRLLRGGVLKNNLASVHAFTKAGFTMIWKDEEERWIAELHRPAKVLINTLDGFNAGRLARQQQRANPPEPWTILEPGLVMHPGLCETARSALNRAASLQYCHIGLSPQAYLVHPARVAVLYLEACDPPCVEGLWLALWHNVLEVSEEGERALEQLSPAVADAVRCLTVDRSLQWDAQYKNQYYDRIQCAPVWVGQIKVLDKIDNLYLLAENPDAEVRTKYLQEIEQHIMPLAREVLPQVIDLLNRLLACNKDDRNG
ncbi:MAG: GNAT family N-acetyltransferase [Candidatus Methylacidiphilales bacterium]